MSSNFKHIGLYKCECGKEFTSSQAFNGHKGHCEIHQISKYGSLDKLIEHNKKCTEIPRQFAIKAIKKKAKEKAKERKVQKNLKWLSEQHTCEKCGKVMTIKYGSGRFCSSECAHSRVITKKQRDLISTKLKGNKNNFKKVYCSNCGCELISDKEKYRKFCYTCKPKSRYTEDGKVIVSPQLHEKLSRAGRNSAKIQSEIRRSKNEIYFCELCENYFKDVKHNEPMFNGWDADVIIEDIRYAVLWNGKWHYEKITKKHSVEQVQNRDKIKLGEIVKAGYTPYIIKDMGKYNKEFVESEFNKFISSL